MKQHLNTLFVTTQGTYLARQRQAVLVRVEGKTRMHLPIHNLGGIVCFGNVGASPFLLGLCAQHNVAVSFLSQSGRFLARAVGQTSGNVLLRREQYRRADDATATAALARAVIAAKIANSRSLLLRAVRDRPDAPGATDLTQTAGHLAQHLRDLEGNHDLDVLRGFEGSAARAYFAVFDHLIGQQKDDFRFTQRSRRPPLDNVNALLSFLYTLLRHDVQSALECTGLDPAVGFLHRDRPGRPGLALDLMEELRPLFADRLALTLINRRQVQAKGFTQTESGSVEMDEATRKTVLTAYQQRKSEEIEHPFLQEKMTLGLIPHIQALLLARHLRGDLDGYPPYLPR